MEPLANLLSNTPIETSQPAPTAASSALSGPDDPAWRALANALERRDERAVVNGIHGCRTLLCDDDGRLLHALVGRLVEDGFGRLAIEACAAMGADLRHVDASGRTLLHRAIAADCRAGLADRAHAGTGRRIPAGTLEYLVQRGGPAMLDAGDEAGRTPLMMALGNDDVAAWLLRKGARIDATDRDGNTCLLRSIACGARETVDWLLAEGAEPLSTARPDGMNALTFAAHRLDRTVVRLLIQRGMPISATDARGRTVLHAVAMLPPMAQDTIAFARDLLDSGAPVNAADDEGCTPLMFAALTGHTAMARLLLQRGADATLASGPDRLHRTALHLAVAMPPQPHEAQPRPRELIEQERSERGELVELLIDAGAKVDAVDAVGCTALLIAVDERCRAAYLALQNAYHARGIALTPRELMLMADRGVMPVAAQIAFARLGKECVALRNTAADAVSAQASLERERDALLERVRALQVNQACSDERFAVLDLQLTDAREEIASLAERLAVRNAEAGRGG